MAIRISDIVTLFDINKLFQNNMFFPHQNSETLPKRSLRQKCFRSEYESFQGLRDNILLNLIKYLVYIHVGN